MVLITGLEVVGYVLAKFVGKKKGLAVTSLVSGFVSSTSSTIAIAKRAKEGHSSHLLVAGIVLANLASFVHMFVLIASINSS